MPWHGHDGSRGLSRGHPGRCGRRRSACSEHRRVRLQGGQESSGGRSQRCRSSWACCSSYAVQPDPYASHGPSGSVGECQMEVRGFPAARDARERAPRGGWQQRPRWPRGPVGWLDRVLFPRCLLVVPAQRRAGGGLRASRNVYEVSCRVRRRNRLRAVRDTPQWLVPPFRPREPDSTHQVYHNWTGFAASDGLPLHVAQNPARQSDVAIRFQ